MTKIPSLLRMNPSHPLQKDVNSDNLYETETIRTYFQASETSYILYEITIILPYSIK